MHPCLQMREGPICLSPRLGLRFWPTSVDHTRPHSLLTHLSRTSTEVWLLITCMSQHHKSVIKTKRQLCPWVLAIKHRVEIRKGIEFGRQWKMVISSDPKTQIMTSQITIWVWYLHYIMTSDDKWTAIMQSFNHNVLVEVTLLRFTSALGKWALDSGAETTLFNVTTVGWIFGIICYVVPSMFMTADPSSSKLYVKF